MLCESVLTKFYSTINKQAIKLCSWKGNHEPIKEQWPPTAGFLTVTIRLTA